MPRTRAPSAQTVRVLLALAADPSRWRYGYELGQQVGLKAGSLYPILIRLSERELLEREARAAQRRLKAARFPSPKTLDAFDFAAAPKVNRPAVLELARLRSVVAGLGAKGAPGDP